MPNSHTRSEIERRFESSQNALVIQSSDFSLQGLREMVENNIIDLTPKYQRRERWDVSRQSELIESFLLNIPVPPIYLSEDNYGEYSIIDGKQRVTAISDFLNNAYSLRGLEAFSEINGLRFRDLPASLQGALKVRPFLRVITLLKQSKPELKYEVFIRLNRGGVRLNSQEIRNVAFRGNLNDEIYAEAENNKFLRVALNITSAKSSAFQKMQDAELITRFLTLRNSWESFSGSFAKSMDNYMMENSELDMPQAKAEVDSFREAIARVEELWGDHAFQRWDGTRWRQQALAGMFDAQMLAASKISAQKFVNIKNHQQDVLEETKKLFSDETFEEAVRLGTNTPARMKYRVSKIFDAITNIS